MKLIGNAAILVVLAATAVYPQSASSPNSPTAGPLPSNRRMVMPRSNAEGNAAAMRGQIAMRQRVQEMGDTLSKMHALLKQMRTSAGAGAAKNPVAKANAEMWELMLVDLDKQYEQLRLATHAREDLDARRNAMYKQAEARAAISAQNSKAPAAVQQAPVSVSGQSAAEPTAAQRSAPPTTSPSPTFPN